MEPNLGMLNFDCILLSVLEKSEHRYDWVTIGLDSSPDHEVVFFSSFRSPDISVQVDQIMLAP